MSLDELLAQLRTRRLCLTFSRSGLLTFWPGQRVPRPIRAALRSYRQEIQEMIREGRIEICENADLHRAYWRYAGAGGFRCAMCERWYAA